MNNPQGTIRVLPHLVDIWTQPRTAEALKLFLKGRTFTFAP